MCEYQYFINQYSSTEHKQQTLTSNSCSAFSLRISDHSHKYIQHTALIPTACHSIATITTVNSQYFLKTTTYTESCLNDLSMSLQWRYHFLDAVPHGNNAQHTSVLTATSQICLTYPAVRRVSED